GGAFALASRFLDFPDFLERIADADEIDDSHFVFVVEAGRRPREVEVEILEEAAEGRIDWEAAGGLSHTGMLTFHPRAPSLTRIELTIDREPQSLAERLWRQTHMAGRVIQGELHRFKAHAELLDEDFDDYVPQAETSPNEEEPEEDEPEP